jgi:hypothetical protein
MRDQGRSRERNCCDDAPLALASGCMIAYPCIRVIQFLRMKNDARLVKVGTGFEIHDVLGASIDLIRVIRDDPEAGRRVRHEGCQRMMEDHIMRLRN